MSRILKQFTKFGIVGVICFVIDYGVMVLLTEACGTPYLLSCGISFSISVVVNYYLSMKYVFASRDDMSKRKEFIIFVILSVIGLLLTEALMWIIVDILAIHYMVSKVLVTGIVMIFNFITRKLFIEARGESVQEC